MEKERSLTTPEEMAELAVLFDIYGPLLKENQRDILGAYVQDNLSLSEISVEYGMTRQGIYDNINRTRKKLREYETEMHLAEKLQDMQDCLERMREKDAGGHLGKEIDCMETIINR